MTAVVLLDAGPLGMASNPLGSTATEACNRWLEALLAAGASVMVPEIADYEVRRELLRAQLTASIDRLDRLKQTLGFLPLDSEAFLTAAEFWARARQMGRSTADDRALAAGKVC